MPKPVFEYCICPPIENVIGDYYVTAIQSLALPVYT
jgi:hypothetical protein